MKYFFNYILLYLMGGGLYCLIEILWRGRTHYSMFFAGGTVFIILVYVGKEMKEAPLILKCLLGALIITAVEFLFGYIFNIKYKMGVWDYSNLPLNILGQICLPFSALWFLLCGGVFKLILTDWFYAKILFV